MSDQRERKDAGPIDPADGLAVAAGADLVGAGAGVGGVFGAAGAASGGADVSGDLGGRTELKAPIEINAGEDSGAAPEPDASET